MAITIGATGKNQTVVAPPGKWTAPVKARVNQQAAKAQQSYQAQQAAARKAAALRAAIASNYQNTIEGLPETSQLNAEQIAGSVAAPYQQTYNVAPAYRPPTPVYQSTGAGRTRQIGTSADSEGAGGSPAPVAAIADSPAVFNAPPAAMEPPAVIADANAGANNVAGESFTSLGNNMTAGEYLRQRGSRGPKTGLSVTPEMIRRAAGNRLG
jgi:hypothetical protein